LDLLKSTPGKRANEIKKAKREDNFPMSSDTRLVDITPDPSLLPKSGQVNYTIPDAVGELIDNAVDERIAGELLTVNVYLGQKDGGTIRVEDDGRGMSSQTLGDAMRMGYSAKATSAIGKFGLGMKTACTNLGRSFEIVTAIEEDKTAHRVVYDEEAFLAANKWAIEIEEIEKPFSHGTAITITNPKVSIYGGVDDTVSIYAGRVFRHFISNDQIQIVVNDVPVAPAEWDLEDDVESFDFEINGKRVHGWVGFQRVFTPKGGYGLDLIRHSRVVKRHEKVSFSAHSKNNKIVGEAFLDDFEVINNKTDFVRDTDDWRQFEQQMADVLRPLVVLAGRKYSGDMAVKDKNRIEEIEDKFEAAVRSEEFARALDRQMLADLISDELAPTEVEKRDPPADKEEDGDKSGDVVEIERETRPRTPKETHEVLRRTRTRLLELLIEHVPVRYGAQSIYKTWDIEGLGSNRRIVVKSNLDHPMFSHLNDTITWVKHNIAEAVAEYVSKDAGIEDALKIKSDILRFVGELEIAEEEQAEEVRVS
jgi:hypothetical protein